MVEIDAVEDLRPIPRPDDLPDHRFRPPVAFALGKTHRASRVAPQVEDEIDVGTLLGQADIHRTDHVHRDIVADLVLHEERNLLEHIQPLIGFPGLEHPVELLELVVEFDLRDMGIFHHLGVEILPSPEGVIPLMIDNSLHPPAIAHAVSSDIGDPLLDEFLQAHPDDPVRLKLDDIEKPSLVHLCGDVRHLTEIGGVEKERVFRSLKAASGVDVAGKRQGDGIGITKRAKRRRTGRAGRGDAVMNAVGGLVGHDDVRLYCLEKGVHLVVFFIHTDSRPVLHDVALGDPGGPDVSTPVARDPQLIKLVPVEMEILFVQGGIFEVHVVVAGKAEDAGILFQGDDAFQDLVFLLHDPPRPDRVLLIGRPSPLDLIRGFRQIEEFIDKILDPHVGLSHPPPQPVEIGLEFVVTDGHPHVIEGDVDQIPGNDVDIGDRFAQKGLDLLKGAVDVGHIDQPHVRRHRLVGTISSQ